MTAERKVTRKLRAILSADVKGYSTLMTNDEVSTIQTLKEYRNIMSGIINDHSGNVVDMPGDNIMAEFSSVVNAVKSSVAIQKALKSKNDALPNDRRLEFRIGINIGDVVQDGDSLYGEGVNIAARIEGLADPGGICISRGAYDHIRNKLNFGYEYIGEHTVKNIKNPVRVYKIRMAPEDAGKLIGDKPKPQSSKWIFSTIIVAAIALTLIGYQLYQKISTPEFEPASIERMALPLPEKPSIAVLAFDNMSGDQEQEYFCDGLAEEIIAALSSVPELFVIARNSSFLYKGKPVKVQQISEELGVQYILEGSVRKSGENVRITAQLINALNGHHLWAENYDGKEEDAIGLQEDIAMKVITELQVKITGRENFRLREPCSQNPKAYLKYLKALGHVHRFTKEDNVAAIRLAKEAIAIDTEYACAYSLLGWSYWINAALGLSQSPKAELISAMQMVSKAIELKPSYAGPHAMLARIKTNLGQYDHALIEAEKSIATEPESGLANFSMGYVLMHLERAGEAIPFFKKAVRLDPFSTPRLWTLGLSYFLDRQYEESIQTCKKALNQNSKFFRAWKTLAVSYSALGRMDEAKAAVSSVHKFEPGFDLEKYLKSLLIQPSDKNLIIDNLCRAGLLEKPSLSLPDKPSIAVLPFDNMSGNSDQEYFSDGMTDELISDLAKIENILVISRNSTFTYKGRPTKVQEIAKDLNVRYILEGSVQKYGNKVRIRAQLIDGKTDHHIWSESYDGIMDDIFELQDKVTGKIVSALSIKLSADEQSTLTERRTNSLPAHDAYLKGMAHLRLWTPDDLVKAIKYFEEAVKLDPNYGQGYTALAEAYARNQPGGREYWQKTKMYPEESSIFMRHYIDMAMKNPVPKTFALLASSERAFRHFGKAVRYAEKAIELAPNDADVLLLAGNQLSFVGKPQKALKCFKKSNLLDPLNRSLVLMVRPYFILKQYGNAVDSFEKSILNVRELSDTLPFAAASYAYLGRKEEAKATLDKWINIIGRIGVDRMYSSYPNKDPEVFDRLMKGLAKAGRDGSITDYNKVDKKYKLPGQKIKALMFGKTEATSGYFYKEFFHRKENGEVSYQVGDTIKKGISWIKDDMLCNKLEGFANGCDDCADIYRNPLGEYTFKNEYLKVKQYKIIPFSIEQLEN